MSELSFLSSQHDHCGEESPAKNISYDVCQLIIRYCEIYEKQEKISRIIEIAEEILQIKISALLEIILKYSHNNILNYDELLSKCQLIQKVLLQIGFDKPFNATDKYKILLGLGVGLTLFQHQIRANVRLNDFREFMMLTTCILCVIQKNLDYNSLNNLSICELNKRLLILGHNKKN